MLEALSGFEGEQNHQMVKPAFSPEKYYFKTVYFSNEAEACTMKQYLVLKGLLALLLELLSEQNKNKNACTLHFCQR